MGYAVWLAVLTCSLRPQLLSSFCSSVCARLRYVYSWAHKSSRFERFILNFIGTNTRSVTSSLFKKMHRLHQQMSKHDSKHCANMLLWSWLVYLLLARYSCIGKRQLATACCWSSVCLTIITSKLCVSIIFNIYHNVLECTIIYHTMITMIWYIMPIKAYIYIMLLHTCTQYVLYYDITY